MPSLRRSPAFRRLGPGSSCCVWRTPVSRSATKTTRAVSRGRKRHHFLAGEPITDIDTIGTEALRDLIDELAEDGVELAFAELKGPVKGRMRRYGVDERIGRDSFFSTTGHVVHEYRDSVDDLSG